MDKIEIRRLKRCRDLYGKIAEILRKVHEKDNSMFDIMLSSAECNKAYLEGYVEEALKNELLEKYGDVQGVVDTMPQQ